MIIQANFTGSRRHCILIHTTTHAQERARNRLESSVGQLDITPTPGVGRELSADDKAVPFPLPRIPGILPHMKRSALSFQHAALGGSDQCPGGAPQNPP